MVEALYFLKYVKFSLVPLIIQASVHTIWIFLRLFEQNKLFLCNFQGQYLSYFSILTTKIAKVDVRTNFKVFFSIFRLRWPIKYYPKTWVISSMPWNSWKSIQIPQLKANIESKFSSKMIDAIILFVKRPSSALQRFN